MLLRFQLRQKWLWLYLWLIGITAFASGYVSAFEKIAEDQGKVGLLKIQLCSYCWSATSEIC